ncbi:unnamed protein product [Phaeothamnion confervicola]
MHSLSSGNDGPPQMGSTAELWQLYKRALVVQPVRTKAFTAAAIAALGELMGTQLRKGGPGNGRARLRRLWAFTIYGLANGPFFHWWFGVVERLGARVSSRTGGRHVVAFKVALDRLLMTPPFLVATLVSLQWLQTFQLRLSLRHARTVYWGALVLNWKLWTVAQLINFNYVPIEFRPLFGNCVAFWWNMYLSLQN